VLDGTPALLYDNTGGAEQFTSDASSSATLWDIYNTGAGSAAEISGGFKATRTVNQVASTSTVLVAGDAGETIFCTDASANNITLPPALAANVGLTYLIVALGVGAVSIVADTGVPDTINGAPTVTIQNQWSAATVIQYTSGKWVAIGDL
jgi:hypothetical protein